MPLPTQTEIRDRFSKDVDGILRFVDFLRSAVGLDRMALHRVNSTLREVGLEQFALPTGNLRSPIEPQDRPRVAQNLCAIEERLPEVLQAYEYENSLDNKFVQSVVSEA